MNDKKYYDYFSSLSAPDLLRVTLGCQKRYEEGKSCEDCHIYKKGHCDGKRDLNREAEDKMLLEDLHLEQQEQL